MGLPDYAEFLLWGTDDPNIPYAYCMQLGTVVRPGLGDDWLRAVLHDNAAGLIGMSTFAHPSAASDDPKELRRGP